MKVRIIKEVYSEKQRKFFCASDDPKLKAKCDDPIKKEVLSEGIDTQYLNSIGIAVGKKLGEGMFGKVFEVVADIGEGMKEYALKYVNNSSKGYAQERLNYQAVKRFVELSKIRQDAEAIKLSKILPVIYSVSEYGDGLYIVMEKLIPLSSEESKMFMSELSGLAYYYSKGKKNRGEQLIDYITDRDGNVGINFGTEMATAYAKAIIKGPEYNHLKKDPQALIRSILRGGNSSNVKKIMDIWESVPGFDEIRHFAIEELYRLNKGFNKILNGVCKILINEFDNPRENPNAEGPESEADFIGMIMTAIFDVTFAQKYPMKYVKSGDWESPYETGHGQSSEIWDADVQPNPKLREQKKQYGTKDVTANPMQGGGSKTNPQKYPFDAFISAIRRLGRDWNIEAKDMHQANVMKRADGQFVVADIGLFSSRKLKSMQSGIFESKRKIKVKII